MVRQSLYLEFLHSGKEYKSKEPLLNTEQGLRLHSKISSCYSLGLYLRSQRKEPPSPTCWLAEKKISSIRIAFIVEVNFSKLYRGLVLHLTQPLWRLEVRG